MDEELKHIYHQFEGKLVGKTLLKIQVCKVLNQMPKDIINFVTQNCWFLGSLEDAWAFTFTGNDLKDQHLIFLSDELFEQDQHQMQYSIAHEIGHVMLGHRNSVVVQQSPEEIQQQEREADAFAKQYIK